MKAAETSTLAIALALGAQAGAQSAPQTPQTTFRSSVELVEVDVIVRDSDGRFVTDLTASDLELYEDGRRQKIVDFYLVEGAAGAGALGTGETPDARPAGRRFVFVFDEDHLTGESVHR